MIPVQLQFSGLYSYQKKQTINFSTLMAAQLFGIFGAVGSGKSTILEAIMFVLYDRSDRLNKSGDNRYYNMLNLQSDKLEIDFTFRANIQSSTKYRAYFCAQRKKKDFEKVEVKERGLYEWKQDQWIPLEDTDASAVLGMTYENFMQTVIIPQGKFREFIDQRPNERTQMLKELFQLHRFDLGAKTGSLLRKAELAITDLKARLLEIGQVSEDDIAELKQQLKEAEGLLNQNQQLAVTLDQQCQGLNALRNLLDKIDDTDQELKQLTEQLAYYNDKEQQLRAYTKAETFFNEKFRLLEETTVEYQRSVEEIKKLEARIKRGKEEVAKAEQSLILRKQEYEQREAIQLQCQDLQHLAHIRQLEPQWQQASRKLASLKKEQAVWEQSWIEQQQQLEEYENQIAKAEKERSQWHILQEVQTWLLRQQELTEENQSLIDQLKKYDEQLVQLEERRESVLTAYGWPDDSENISNDFTSFQSQLHQQQDAVQKEISELRVQEKLAQAASQLQPGQPCLLCGSTEHPQIIHSPSVKKALAEKQQELLELRQKESAFRELQQTIQKIISQIESVQGVKQQMQQQQVQLRDKIAQHSQLHRWDQYQSITLAELSQQLQKIKKEQQALENLQQLRKTGAEELKKLQQQKDHLQKSEQNLVTEQSGYQAAINQHSSMLQSISSSDYAAMDASKIQQLREEKQTKLASLEQEYEKGREMLQEYRNTLNLLESRKEIAEENLLKLQQKGETLNEEIQSLCVDKDFASVNEIKELIDLELDTDTEQQEIQTYRYQLHNAEVTLHKLQAERQGRAYDPQEHRQLELKLQKFTEEVRQQQEDRALLKQRIRDGQEKQARTQTIQAKLAEQQLRESNLKELASLFRGSGFVKYASTVLLDNLCRVANQRFMQLT
ncbi:MAG: SMC family ATPase, partial [Bacteroidota bacterium]